MLEEEIETAAQMELANDKTWQLLHYNNREGILY